MTQFDKEKFHYHGGYLMYHGTYEGQPTYDEYYGKDKIHPSRRPALCEWRAPSRSRD